MLYRVVTKTSETRSSIDQYDMSYLLQLYEGVEFDSHIEKLQYKDAEEQKALAEVGNGGAGAAMAAAMGKSRMR